VEVTTWRAFAALRHSRKRAKGNFQKYGYPVGIVIF